MATKHPEPTRAKVKPAAEASDNGERQLTQREKFIQAAREAGCDETGEEFERAFSRAFPPRNPGEPVAPYVEQPAPKGSRRKAKAEPG